MSQTIKLMAGESHQIGDTTITIAKFGKKCQGGGQPEPIVTIEIQSPERSPEPSSKVTKKTAKAKQ